jgi:hypothetical protein
LHLLGGPESSIHQKDKKSHLLQCPPSIAKGNQ